MKKTTGILLAGILSVCMAGGALAAEETGVDEIALLEQRMIQLYQGYQYLAEDNGVDRILDLSGLEGENRDILADGFAAVSSFFEQGEKETELEEELQEADDTDIRLANLESMLDAVDEIIFPFEPFTTDFDDDIPEDVYEAATEEMTEPEEAPMVEMSEREMRIEQLDTGITTGEIVLAFLQNTLQPVTDRSMPGMEGETEVAAG